MFYVICFLVVGVILYLKWKNGYWRRRGVFQFAPELFFGDSRRLIMRHTSFGQNVLDRYAIVKRAKEKQAGIYVFTKPVYFPVDVNIIKNILQNDFKYFVNRGTYHTPKDVLSMGLINLEDDAWRNLRAKLTPTFTSGKMKMMFETLLEKTVELTKVTQEYANSCEPCAIKDLLARFTIDVIASCAFGIECNSLQDPDNIFMQHALKTLQRSKKFRLLLTSLIPWKLLGYFNYKVEGSDVTNFFTKLVHDTIKYREANNVFRKDFMHLLIQLKNSDNSTGDTKKHIVLTKDEIIAQCFIFFVAGFETSSAAMTMAVLELAQNQSIQDTLREEIAAVLEKYEGNLTYEAVMEMKYLDNVVQESLRMYPPLPAILRVCNANYKVPGTDLILEKNTRVQIPLWGLQRDPEYFPDPGVFNPDNFNEENKAKRPDIKFIPFGGGPRTCIGLRFGLLQTKMGLISLIRNFNFTVNAKTKYPIKMDTSTFILSVAGGTWLNITKV